MIVLGIETATAQVSCAVGGPDGVMASFSAVRDRRHAEMVTPAVAQVCDAAGVELSQVRVVAVGIGPGLFTGLRVGVATGKAIAQALRVPMIGMTSLDLLAHVVRFSPRLVLAAIDARRGELFAAYYRHVPGGTQRVSDYALFTPDNLASDLVARGEECLVVGDGIARHAAAFESVDGLYEGGPGTRYPSARALVELAHPRAVREEFVTPAEVRPLYLRKTDAEINWTTRESA